MARRRTCLSDATAGVANGRTSFQNEAVACGSRSMIAATLPACSAATARQVASVVFPTPPFCERMARTFMLHSYQYSPIIVYAENRGGKPYPPRNDDRAVVNRH